MSDQDVQKHSIRIAGHRTSFSLEPAFWEVLKQLAQDEQRTLSDLVAFIDKEREGNLSSALRLYVLRALQGRLKES